MRKPKRLIKVLFIQAREKFYLPWRKKKKKCGSVVEAGIYKTVSGTQKFPKIKYTETNGHQKASDVSCRLRRIGLMMKCS